jgi:hypothetical protein
MKLKLNKNNNLKYKIMIIEYLITNSENTVLKKVYCSNIKQAIDKANFLFPKTFTSIDSIKKGRQFKNFSEFLQKK